MRFYFLSLSTEAPFVKLWTVTTNQMRNRLLARNNKPQEKVKKGIPEKSERRPWRWGERNGVDLSQTVFSWWPFLIAHLPAFRHRAACHYLYTSSLLLLAGAAMISSVLCLFPRTPPALKTISGVSCGCRHCFCVGLSADVSGLSFQDWPSSGGRVTNSYALSDCGRFFFRNHKMRGCDGCQHGIWATADWEGREMGRAWGEAHWARRCLSMLSSFNWMFWFLQSSSGLLSSINTKVHCLELLNSWVD